MGHVTPVTIGKTHNLLHLGKDGDIIPIAASKPMLRRDSVSPPEPREDQRLSELVAQVADSETFRPAPTLRALLLYLWTHRADSVSEYAIAVDALGRPPDFDPKGDATVRVTIARLRTKLEEFFSKQAPGFPLYLSVPKGSHELKWTMETPADAASAAVSKPSIPPRYWIAAALVVAALTAVIGALLWQNLALKAGTDPSPPMPRFWKTFLANGKPTVIVVPSPLYFVWPDRSTYVRDLNLSTFSSWPTSPFLRELADRWGPPAMSQTYVGAVEMGVAVSIVQYLERRGRHVDVVESARLPVESFASQNTIAIGMPRTASYLSPLFEKTNFRLTRVNPDAVANRVPRPGEKPEFLQTTYSAEHVLCPGIITLLPRRPEGARTLLLTGRWANGVAPPLLTAEGLRQLEEHWVKAGSPDGWEMVVEAEIFRETVRKVTPLAFRAISSAYWQ